MWVGLARLGLGACMLVVCAACGDDAESSDAGSDRPEPLDPEVAYATELRSLDDLEVLSAPELSESVKYLARIEGKDALPPLEEACYFQNMNRYPWHLQFLQSFRELRGATLDSYR